MSGMKELKYRMFQLIPQVAAGFFDLNHHDNGMIMVGFTMLSEITMIYTYVLYIYIYIYNSNMYVYIYIQTMVHNCLIPWLVNNNSQA